MENIRIHSNNKRSEKEKQKLRAAKTVYKDGTKPERNTTKKAQNATTTTTQQPPQSNNKTTKLIIQ